MAQTKVTKPGITDDAVTTAKILDDAVTTAKILDDNVTTDKILNLNVTNAKIAAGTIDVTSKITGKVPAANLGTGTASATTYLAGNQSYQTITAYNDDALQNDIATLALHQATNANAAKYNLVNTNVDQFEDSTGVTSFTDCARVADGTQQFVASVYSAIEAFTSDSDTVILMHGEDLTDSSGNALTVSTAGGVATSTTQYKFGSKSIFFDSTDDTLMATDSGFNMSNTNWTLEAWLYMNDLNAAMFSISNQTISGASCSPGDTALLGMYNDGSSYGTGSANHWDFPQLDCGSWSTGVWSHWVNTRDGVTWRSYKDGVQQDTESLGTSSFLTHTNFRMGTGGCWGWAGGYMDECRFSSVCRYPDGTTFVPNQTTVTSATGNFISTDTVANASVSKVGIVMTYKNNSGTNTLNTDIIAQVSADGGSNYSTVVLAAGGTFATGILQAVANDVSVTAGTNIRYKILFANQASGSKEARIYGVSLIY